MIEQSFGLVNPEARPRGRKSRSRMTRNSCPNRRNRSGLSGVYRAMKRDSSVLLAATLRTGLMVVVAIILILVLLPAVLAAQAAAPR